MPRYTINMISWARWHEGVIPEVFKNELGCELVWPSGKQRDLGSTESASALVSLQKLWSVDSLVTQFVDHE